MNNVPNSENIVVITEEKKRRKGMLWVAAGAACLVAGGSTFALWGASDTISGGTITAGDLNITRTADTTHWDVSADRNDATDTVTGTDGTQKGHSITSLTDWRMVPGDKLAASFSTDVTLEGDNLVGALSIQGLDGTGVAGEGKSAFTDDNVTYTYEVYSDGVKVISESALPVTGDDAVMYLSAPGTGQAAGLEDATNKLGAGVTVVDGATAQNTVFEMAETTENVSVVVYAEFDADTAERVDVSAEAALADLTVSLDQVRDAGAQFKSVDTEAGSEG